MFFFSLYIFSSPYSSNKTNIIVVIVSGNEFPQSVSFPINFYVQFCYFIMVSTMQHRNRNTVVAVMFFFNIIQNGVFIYFFFVSSTWYYCVYITQTPCRHEVCLLFERILKFQFLEGQIGIRIVWQSPTWFERLTLMCDCLEKF